MKIKYLFFILLSLAVADASSNKLIVFLHGTSRSGKSSISKQIQKYNNWTAISSTYFDFFPQEFDTLFPQEYRTICAGITTENIRHAITRDMYIFKTGVPYQQQTNIRRSAKIIQDYYTNQNEYKKHMDNFKKFSFYEICNQMSQNKNILIDACWYVSLKELHERFPDRSTKKILLYCPLTTIITRLRDTNERSLLSQNIVNYRFYREPLLSFSSLYQLVPSADGAIDSISKKEFDALLKFLEKNISFRNGAIVPQGFMMLELSQQEFELWKTQLLKQFEMKDILYIKPKEQYDAIINTNELLLEECVKKIIAQTDSSHF